MALKKRVILFFKGGLCVGIYAGPHFQMDYKTNNIDIVFYIDHFNLKIKRAIKRTLLLVVLLTNLLFLLAIVFV